MRFDLILVDLLDEPAWIFTAISESKILVSLSQKSKLTHLKSVFDSASIEIS
ncbi:MAG: hypothetical protein IPO31_24780 [Candidatus Obscuribacter sp.]|nr:hypothetical protein [Candidatus Obscuribacter sp.]